MNESNRKWLWVGIGAVVLVCLGCVCVVCLGSWFFIQNSTSTSTSHPIDSAQDLEPEVTGTFTAVQFSTPNSPFQTAPTVPPLTAESLETGIQMGEIAPDFELMTLEDVSASLSARRGGTVLVNFWATWCPPCMDELPAFETIFREYRDSGLDILGVNATDQDTASSVRDVIDDVGLTYTVVLDEQGLVQRQYAIQFFPTTYFIDSNGVIRDIVIGGMTEDELRNKVQEIVTLNH